MFLQFQQPAPIRLVQVLTDAQNSTSTLESNKELRERCEQEFGVRPQMRIVKVPMISEQVRVKFVDVELNLPQVNHETGVSICGDEAALKAHQFDSYFVMNTHGKTHLAVLHEYAQKVLKVFLKKYLKKTFCFSSGFHDVHPGRNAKHTLALQCYGENGNDERFLRSADIGQDCATGADANNSTTTAAANGNGIVSHFLPIMKHQSDFC
jgi:hypothetical protein